MSKNPRILFILSFSLLTLTSYSGQATDLNNVEELKLIKQQGFEQALTNIGDEIYPERLPLIQEKRNVLKPSIFISYAWEADIKTWVAQQLSQDLSKIGFEVLYDQERIHIGSKLSSFEAKVSTATYVVVLCTPKYLERYNQDKINVIKTTGVGREVERLVNRLHHEDLKDTIFPVYRKGGFMECVPGVLHEIAAFDISNDDSYHQTFFTLMQSFFLYDHINSQPLKTIRDNLSCTFDVKQMTAYNMRKGLFADPQQAYQVYHQHYLKNPDAHNETMLGRMYLDGFGVITDLQQGDRLIYKHALNGRALAQYNLGLMYDNGKGVSQNDAEAVKWYSKAADQGMTPAQYNLGFMYDNGQGVPQNDTEAVKWYSKAADQGDAAAQSALSFIYDNGKGVPQDDEGTINWYCKVTNQGYALAQYGLGLIYADGRGVPQDDAEAVNWYSKAAGQGHASAQRELARLTSNQKTCLVQ